MQGISCVCILLIVDCKNIAAAAAGIPDFKMGRRLTPIFLKFVTQQKTDGVLQAFLEISPLKALGGRYRLTMAGTRPIGKPQGFPIGTHLRHNLFWVKWIVKRTAWLWRWSWIRLGFWCRSWIRRG